VVKQKAKCAKENIMALKDITSQKDLVAERDRNQAKIKQDREDARAAQQEELRKANYLKERRVGNNLAYQQFKKYGTEGIDTGENLGPIDKYVFGQTKDDPRYQAAREMKSALENERAKANVSDALDAQRKAMYDSARKQDMGLPAGAQTYKKGGKVKAKKMASGGKVSSASKRADGIATKGKTRGRMI
jgi:hypothetical protein